MLLQLLRQLVWLGRQFFGHADKVGGNVDSVFDQVALDALRLLEVFGLDKRRQGLRVAAQVVDRRLALDLVRGAVVDDVKVFTQSDESRALTYDVVRQPVQRAHAVADARQQAAAAQECRRCGRGNWRRRCW